MTRSGGAAILILSLSGFLLSSCAGLSSISNGLESTPHQSAPASSPTTTSLVFSTGSLEGAFLLPFPSITPGSVQGTIGPATATVSRPGLGRTVRIQGSFSKHAVSLVIAHISKGTSLTFPPIDGSFSTSVTLTASPPNNPGLVTFYAGPQTGEPSKGMGA